MSGPAAAGAAEAPSVETFNENEDTSNTPQPIENQGGEGVTSFDDLERALSTPKDSKKEKLADSKEKPQVKDKDNKEAKASEEQKENDNGQEAQEAQEVEETKEKLLSKAAAKTAIEKQKETGKLYKVKSGDGKEIDLNGNAEITLPVKGKLETFKVQDLINEHSGKTDWNRRYSELENERKTFHKERDTILGTIDRFYDLGVKQKDPYGAVQFLGEITGANMQEFWSQFNAKVLPELEEELRLDPIEREKRQLAKENEYYRKQAETQKQAQAQKMEHDFVTQHVKALQETHKIDDKNYYETYEELRRSGQVDFSQMKPTEAAEFVANYYVEVQTRKGLDKLVSEIAPDLDPTDREKAIDDLRKVMTNDASLTEDDIKMIATQVYGSKASKNLSRKLQKSKPTDTARPTRARRENPVTFEDLE